MVFIAHVPGHSPIRAHTVWMKGPLSLCCLHSFCVALPAVVSGVILLSALLGGSALLAGKPARVQMKLVLAVLLPSVLFCWEEKYFHWCKAVTVLKSRLLSLVLFLFTFQRFCFSKAHGGRRWPCCLDDNQMPVQNMSIHQCSTALPPISQDKRF